MTPSPKAEAAWIVEAAEEHAKKYIALHNEKVASFKAGARAAVEKAANICERYSQIHTDMKGDEVSLMDANEVLDEAAFDIRALLEDGK